MYDEVGEAEQSAAVAATVGSTGEQRSKKGLGSVMRARRQRGSTKDLDLKSPLAVKL